MTGGRLHPLPLLLGVFVVGVGVAPALGQTSLTLEDAIRRAQGETADARALASAIDEANARSSIHIRRSSLASFNSTTLTAFHGPETTNAITSRSRGVSDAQQLRRNPSLQGRHAIVAGRSALRPRERYATGTNSQNA